MARSCKIIENCFLIPFSFRFCVVSLKPYFCNYIRPVLHDFFCRENVTKVVFPLKRFFFDFPLGKQILRLVLYCLYICYFMNWYLPFDSTHSLVGHSEAGVLGLVVFGHAREHVSKHGRSFCRRMRAQRCSKAGFYAVVW